MAILIRLVLQNRMASGNHNTGTGAMALGRWTRRVLAGVFSLAGAVTAPSIYYGAEAQSPEDGFEADAVVVFSGGQGRAARGVERWLQDSREHSRVFISGAEEGQTLEAVIGMIYPKILSHPDIEEIELGTRALDTVGNARETAQWLAVNPDLKNIIVVTSDYHLPRAHMELQRVLPEGITVRFEGVSGGLNLNTRSKEVLKTFVSAMGYQGEGPHLRGPD
ncbi:MAG: ElyC/SanA/YdcF family protein [Alphaproteobacteria bacterium]